MASLLNFSSASQAPTIARAHGHYVYDADGREYLDFGFGAGVNIFGHANERIAELSKNCYLDGAVHTYKNSHVDLWLEAIQRFVPPSHHNFVLASTGTEATYRALRYSRAASEKTELARFAGSWHGMNKWLLFDNGSRFNIGDKNMRQGIPDFISSATHTLKFGASESIEYLKKNHGRIGVLFIEPVMGSAPHLNVEFLNEVIEVCRDFGIITVFDEMITGFRVPKAGVASVVNSPPDIIVYGKILGGGYPVGLVCLSDRIRSTIASAYAGHFSAGGTYSANPLVVRISTEVLNMLDAADYKVMNGLADQARSECNSYFRQQGYAMSVVGVDSLLRIAFTDKNFMDREDRDRLEASNLVQAKFKNSMLRSGIIWPSSGLMFTSLLTDRTHIDRLVSAVKASSDELFV